MKKEDRQALAMELLDKAADGVVLPEAVEVIREVMRMIGGPAGFAKMIVDTYHTSPQGSMMRKGICDSLMRMMADLNPKNDINDELGILSDDDIRREIAKLTKPMQVRGRPDPD